MFDYIQLTWKPWKGKGKPLPDWNKQNQSCFHTWTPERLDNKVWTRYVSIFLFAHALHSRRFSRNMCVFSQLEILQYGAWVECAEGRIQQACSILFTPHWECGLNLSILIIFLCWYPIHRQTVHPTWWTSFLFWLFRIVFNTQLFALCLL